MEFEEKLKHEREVSRKRVSDLRQTLTSIIILEVSHNEIVITEVMPMLDENQRKELTMLHNFRAQFVNFNRLLNANLSYNSR